MSSIFLYENKGKNDEIMFEIKFNPQVTNLKRVVQEAPVQTIGSQYPFIRRNAKINYRQFNIGGLISIKAEESQNEQGAQVYIDNYFTSIAGISGLSLASSIEDEIAYETSYRNAVITFLQDGQEKIFSSETEGIFPVYLTNISFTPEVKLGRRIYSFSAQAIQTGDDIV